MKNTTMNLNVRGYNIDILYTVSAPKLGGKKSIIGIIANNGTYKIKYQDKIEGDQVMIFDDGRIVKYPSQEAALYYEIDDRLDITFIEKVINKVIDAKINGIEKSREATIRYIETFR